jgi:hypothetical protein
MNPATLLIKAQHILISRSNQQDRGEQRLQWKVELTYFCVTCSFPDCNMLSAKLFQFIINLS